MSRRVRFHAKPTLGTVKSTPAVKETSPIQNVVEKSIERAEPDGSNSQDDATVSNEQPSTSEEANRPVNSSFFASTPFSAPLPTFTLCRQAKFGRLSTFFQANTSRSTRPRRFGLSSRVRCVITFATSHELAGTISWLHDASTITSISKTGRLGGSSARAFAEKIVSTAQETVKDFSATLSAIRIPTPGSPMKFIGSPLKRYSHSFPYKEL